MSFFLEIFKCILCCEDEYIGTSEDEYIDISDNRTFFIDTFSRTRIYNTFSSLVFTPSSSIDESYSTTRTSNYPQRYSSSSPSSSPINSTRNGSTWQSRPSDIPVERRVVLGPKTNIPTSTESLYLKSLGRDNQGPQNSRSSATCNIYASPTSIKPPQSSTKLIQSPPSPLPSFFKPPTCSPKPPASSKPSPLFTTPAADTLRPSSSSPKPSASSKPSQSSTKPPKPSKSSIWSPNPSSSSSRPSSSFATPTSLSSKPPPSLKPTICPVPSNITDQQGIGKYKWAIPKDTVPVYMIPKDIEDLIKRDIVPEVLKKPLSPSTYQEYFAALLYAEDYYNEKWSDTEFQNVSLDLHPASIYQKSGGNKYSKADNKMDDKTFVVLDIDSLSKKLPFLLSRDFVFAQPSGKEVEPFQGVIYKVLKSKIVLVDFGEEFHSQHASPRKYNISISFNRVCTKRAHEAIAATAPLMQNFLFPNSVSRDIMCISPAFNLYNHSLSQDEKSAVHRILNFRGPPPFLVKGPLFGISEELSRTGLVVKEAVLQIYQRHPGSKILICAPTNSTCDVLMRSLKRKIPESDMFRANAAFREIKEVPTDIIPSCLYEEETGCFSCPSLQELREFRVIFSTFMSSYRLYNAGISAGHFSYIFLADASSATEPETMVALANLADKSTTVIVTGTSGDRSTRVRADIARRNGLRISYFERLSKFGMYKNGNSMFIV